jgi:hypothetical protein
VLDAHSLVQSQVWTTWIYFNQAMNESTIGPALTVSEVRRVGEDGLITIPLVQGVDYTLTEFDPVDNRIGVIFSRTVTDRNLDDDTGEPGDLPGAGVYRFELSADTLRAQVVTARLSGEAEGFGNRPSDYSQDVLVGDAGDKLEPSIQTVGPQRIDSFPPADLDLVLDNNYTPDGLPDPNMVYTVRGAIGDHPDHGIDAFRAAADTDLYKITLRAGQILRLGAMEGSAQFAFRGLLNENGIIQGGITPYTVQLPADPLGIIDLTTESHFLIKQTGTFYIVVTNVQAWLDPDVPTLASAGGIVGPYRFTLEVFDDGKTGFAADTDSGDGTPIVNAPRPIVFAGPSGVFGTDDDRSEIIIGDFVFRLDPGPDGIPGTADDIVTGSNGSGIVSTRIGDQLTTTVDDAIGPRGYAGVPSKATPDIDVYHLNNRQPLPAGQLITVTVKLAEIGADLGSFSPVTRADFRGDVQFAVFDTTNAQAIDDALLVFSPKDFRSSGGGTPGQIASQGFASYGFDENGDFVISFITPGRMDGTGISDATYAIYLQGVFNTDYRLEIVQTDAVQNLPLPRNTANVFLETRGGHVDWLEAGGLTSELDKFTTSVLGFTGSLGNVPIDQYILNQTLANLRAMFNATGRTVNISTNPAEFEFQDFSKVFLTSSNDPITIFNINNFGYSERSDPLNLDRNDESVIFLPSFATLGYTPSQGDVDDFILSLTAAVGRRIGELFGLRMTAPHARLSDPRDVMSANSVQFIDNLGGGNHAFLGQARPLSHRFDVLDDTSFFIGYQNSLAILHRYLQ